MKTSIVVRGKQLESCLFSKCFFFQACWPSAFYSKNDPENHSPHSAFTQCSRNSWLQANSKVWKAEWYLPLIWLDVWSKHTERWDYQTNNIYFSSGKWVVWHYCSLASTSYPQKVVTVLPLKMCSLCDVSITVLDNEFQNFDLIRERQKLDAQVRTVCTKGRWMFVKQCCSSLS